MEIQIIEQRRSVYGKIKDGYLYSINGHKIFFWQRLDERWTWKSAKGQEFVIRRKYGERWAKDIVSAIELAKGKIVQQNELRTK